MVSVRKVTGWYQFPGKNIKNQACYYILYAKNAKTGYRKFRRGPIVKYRGYEANLRRYTMVKKISQSTITFLIINIFSRNEDRSILCTKSFDIAKKNARKKQKKKSHS